MMNGKRFVQYIHKTYAWKGDDDDDDDDVNVHMSGILSIIVLPSISIYIILTMRNRILLIIRLH